MSQVRKKLDLEHVKAFINAQSPETKVYIGCDSERFRIEDTWYADYTTAVVVHIDGCHGCKIFGEIVRERDYDQRKDRPRMRMMNEAIRAAEMYLLLADSLIYEDRNGIVRERGVEIHLDINPDEMHGSSCALAEATGYIRAMCNVVPLIKPQAFAASYAADRLKEIMQHQQRDYWVNNK